MTTTRSVTGANSPRSYGGNRSRIDSNTSDDGSGNFNSNVNQPKKKYKDPPVSGKLHKVLSPGQVFYFVPQLIGYFRCVCTILAMILAGYSLDDGKYWKHAIICYMLSFFGDFFDGMAARKFKQSSTFGGVLDMVTDRITTMGMLIILSWIFKDIHLKLLFMALAFLDISSHWFQMYAAAALRQHHKSAETNKTRFILVRWFYTHYLFFGYCCVGAEFTYISLYILSYCQQSGFAFNALSAFLYFLCVPACAMKNIVNVFQLTSASYAIAEYDVSVYNSNKE